MRCELRHDVRSQRSAPNGSKFYVKNKLRFYQKEALHLRQIILTPMANEGLVPLRQTAKKVIKELDNGANFETSRVIQPRRDERKGGDWGWIERKDIRKELSDIFGLKKSIQPTEMEGRIFILYEDKREEMIQPVQTRHYRKCARR